LSPSAEPRLSDIAVWEALPDGPRNDVLRGFEVIDGLPLARVRSADMQAALEAAGLGAEEIVTPVPPFQRPGTGSALAICALLAGCQPSVFPVVVSAVRGMAAPEFNGVGVLTTTGTAAVTVIVSGQLAHDFNSGPNLLGPGNRANAAVGRAVSLIARAIGGAVPGIGDMSTMGQPGKYTFCFAEAGAEAGNPWEPLHAVAGIDVRASATTVFAASGTVEVTNAYVTSAEDVLDTLAASLYLPGTINYDKGLTGGGRCVALISPDWAAMLASEGLSRAGVADELAARATWPASILPPGLHRPFAEAHANEPDPVLRAAESPDDLLIVVGGGVGTKQTLIPCWAGGSHPVTTAIESAVS
jgi:hypothetical protein